MADTETKPAWWARRIGVSGGRIWHINSGRTEQGSSGFRFDVTMCGKRGDRNWRPRWLKSNPTSICSRCVKLEEELSDD